MIIFASKRGRVVRLNDPAAQMTSINSNVIGGLDPNISFDTEVSIITQMTLAQQVNIQFCHTMGAHIYVYVFGDRVGQISLGGLAFTGACDGGLGPEEMYHWYARNKASKRRAPVLLTVGHTPFEGFVTSFNEAVIDPSTGLCQWQVQMMTMPEDI